MDFYQNIRDTSSTLDEVIKEHLNYADDLKFLKIENIQKGEFANGIIKEELIQEIIDTIEQHDNNSISNDIPEILIKSIRLIKDDLKQMEYEIEQNKLNDLKKQYIQNSLSEENQNYLIDNISDKNEINIENEDELKLNSEEYGKNMHLNLDELVEYIEKDEEFNIKSKKNRKKNSNKKKKLNTNINHNKSSTENRKENYNEYEKEIEEFRKKLKDSSKPAHQSIKIKPVLSKEWILSILKRFNKLKITSY